MSLKVLIYILFLFFIPNVYAFTQDEDLGARVDAKVEKMKTELNLTETQAQAIVPIIKDYVAKRQAIIQEVTSSGIVDHASLKSTLKGLKDTENQRLSKILTPDQMQKWINKENLMASLNPDGGESTMMDDDGVSLSPGGTGANFKF